MDFSFIKREKSIETEHMPSGRGVHVRDGKHEFLKAMKRKYCLEQLQSVPPPGTSYHMVTNARFDFWDFVPTLLKMQEPHRIEELFASTWILNRQNATEMLQLFDAGKIGSINLLTGLYFKRRESATFAMIYEGLTRRGQKFRAAQNHSKWFSTRFANGDALTCESSANFTENGNIETHVLTNDAGLFEFHKAWCTEVLDAG